METFGSATASTLLLAVLQHRMRLDAQTSTPPTFNLSLVIESATETQHIITKLLITGAKRYK